MKKYQVRYLEEFGPVKESALNEVTKAMASEGWSLVQMATGGSMEPGGEENFCWVYLVFERAERTAGKKRLAASVTVVPDLTGVPQKDAEIDEREPTLDNGPSYAKPPEREGESYPVWPRSVTLVPEKPFVASFFFVVLSGAYYPRPPQCWHPYRRRGILS